ncbi:MAG TPA: T9SS type A sorting domain-containing protein, partial [Bacteroidales bacterium]|nr:T9SS type A sorting domain-containing protein [Bacteroidales bacterium]
SGYSPSTHYFTGVLNSGDAYPGTVAASRFYLVGNPYSSSIDWQHNMWETSNNPADNHRNGLESTDGTYDYWVFRDGASGGNYLAGNSGGTYSSGLSKDIAPMQGFFVLTKQGGGLFEITNSVRVHSSQSWVKSAAVQNNVLRLELTTNKNSYRDEVMIDFNDQYSGEGGSYKFGSLYYDAPELWSVKNGNNYTINRYKEITPGLAVNISAKCGVDGTYTLTATNISDFSLSDIVYLEDLKTGTKVDLKAVGSYSFAGSPNDNKERFRVTFAEIAGAGEPGADKPVYIYSYENEVYINASRPETGNCAVYIYDALGRVIYRGSYDPVTGNQRFTTLSTPGAYIVKVVSGSGIVTAKIVIP